jgi:hypothetical protein
MEEGRKRRIHLSRAERGISIKTILFRNTPKIQVTQFPELSVFRSGRDPSPSASSGSG